MGEGGARRPLHTHVSRQGELWPLQVLRQKSRRCTSILLTLKHPRRVKKKTQNDKLQEISIVIKGHLFFFCIHLVKKHTKMERKKEREKKKRILNLAIQSKLTITIYMASLI